MSGRERTCLSCECIPMNGTQLLRRVSLAAAHSAIHVIDTSPLILAEGSCALDHRAPCEHMVKRDGKAKGGRPRPIESIDGKS